MFEDRGMHFIHSNFNSLLPKTEEIYDLAELTNASMIGKSKINRDGYVLNIEVVIEDHGLIRLDRFRKGSDVACFIKHSVAYSQHVS